MYPVFYEWLQAFHFCVVLFRKCAVSFCQIDLDIVTAVIYRIGHARSHTNGVLGQTLTLENVWKTNLILNSFNLKDVYMSWIKHLAKPISTFQKAPQFMFRLDRHATIKLLRQSNSCVCPLITITCNNVRSNLLCFSLTLSFGLICGFE